MAGVVDQELESFMRAEGGLDTTVAQTEVANETKDSAAGKKRKNGADQEANKKPKVQENRAIYITNLPRDATEQEIEETFKKYGIIDQGADGNKRIKMYTDDKEQFNGEALVVYFKKDSIHLAIQMMDDYWFRPEDQKAGKISVKEADFSYKKEKDGEKAAAKLTRKDKKASERNRADMQRKLAEWSDDEEEVVKATYVAPKNKWEKVVIVKHAFTLDELETDKDAYFEIKDDMREEAEKFGAVTNVTLFDKEEDGIITIRFKEFEAAEKFREKCNGRKFSKVPLEVSIAEEKPRFRKSGRGEEPDSDEEERLAAVVQG